MAGRFPRESSDRIARLRKSSPLSPTILPDARDAAACPKAACEGKALASSPDASKCPRMRAHVTGPLRLVRKVVAHDHRLRGPRIFPTPQDEGRAGRVPRDFFRNAPRHEALCRPGTPGGSPGAHHDPFRVPLPGQSGTLLGRAAHPQVGTFDPSSAAPYAL